MSRTFDILLGEPDDSGADFRQKRLGDEIEHDVVIERGEDLFIGCELLPVVHGQYETGSTSDASLVIFDFSFQPNKRARRFVQAKISVVFADEQNKGAEYDPEVKEMSFVPSGRGGYFLLFPTTHVQEVKRTANVSGGGGAFGANLTAGFIYELSETLERKNAAVLVGSKRTRGRPGGRKNAAEWALEENTSTKDGIPTFMRAAVLLHRSGLAKGRKFTAVITINAKVDAITTIEEGILNLFGRRKVPADDAVVFDPDRKDGPASLFKVDPKNLKGQNLEDISIVLSRNILSGAVDGKPSTKRRLIIS